MSEYPEPQVPYAGYSDLYFATERQIRSWVALGNYDRGELSIFTQQLTFRGMRTEVNCPNITAIRLVRKTFPWGIVLVVVVAAAALVYLNSTVPFTWRQPPVYLVAVILLVGCVRQWQERWVEVTYAESEWERRAYFRREPILWGSGSARTRQLYVDLQRVVMSDEATGSAELKVD